MAGDPPVNCPRCLAEDGKVKAMSAFEAHTCQMTPPGRACATVYRCPQCGHVSSKPLHGGGVEEVGHFV